MRESGVEKLQREMNDMIKQSKEIERVGEERANCKYKNNACKIKERWEEGNNRK